MAYGDYLLANFSSGLLGYWKGGEASGNLADSSGGGNTGVANGTPLYSQTGIPGGAGTAVGANGVGDYFQLETAPGSALRCSNFTIAAWFKYVGVGAGTTGGSGTPTLIDPILTKGRGESEGAGFNCNWFLGINRDGANPVLGGFYEESGGAGWQIAGATNVNDGQWHFGVFTYDGSNLNLYLDGSTDATPVAETNGPDSASAQLAAICGALTTAGLNAGVFNGHVCHLSVWNIALTGANISALYTQGATAFPGARILVDNRMNADLKFLPTGEIAVQFSDGDGSGIDDAELSPSTDFVLKKDTVTLTQGTHYSVTVDTVKDRYILAPLPTLGAKFPVGVYQLIFNPS